MGRLLGMQIFLGPSVTQNIIYFSQKPLSFKENDLKSISSWPQQGYLYSEEPFFSMIFFFSVALDFTEVLVNLTADAIAKDHGDKLFCTGDSRVRLKLG